MVQPLWKTVWDFLKTLKIELPYHPETPFLYIQRKWNHCLKKVPLPPWISVLFTIAKVWKYVSIDGSMDEWIKKMCMYVYICINTHIYISLHTSRRCEEMLSCSNSLYIQDINPLSDIWFANSFSCSINCLYIYICVCVCVCVCVYKQWHK